MNTSAIGAHGEDTAVGFLLQNGFTIRQRNWRTRWCEIDIIAQKDHEIYFVEVKQRKNDHYGDGFDAITQDKLQRMQRAADAWMQHHRYSGDARLAVVSIVEATGAVEFIDDL